MTWRRTPPFRADHVGSLIRPPEVVVARQSYLAGEVTREELREVEDRCVRAVVALQERVGLPAVTDGEYRRTSFREVLFESIEGFGSDRIETDFEFQYADGTIRRATPVPRAVAKLRRRRGIATDDFKFLAGVTRGTAKIMLPSPSLAHWFVGDRVFDRSLYSHAREYLADVSRVLGEEIAELAKLGCSYVQIDEVPIAVMCDPKAHDIVQRRGEDPFATVDLYVDAINDALRARPAGMTAVVHMCRGNEGVAGLGSGGYDSIAERVFSRLEADGYLLEYETQRAGDFAPLRFVPNDKIVVIGVISTKERALESKDMIKRRIDEASRHIDPDRLGLCPQCGFDTHFHFDRLTIDDQERKLALLVETAHELWG